MTRYAVDNERSALIGSYPTGAGDVAFTVAVLPDGVASDMALLVASRLDGLSRALWHSYTHPAMAADDGLADNSEGWRRQGEREDFDLVPAALTDPNLPDEEGTVIFEYGIVAESAHRLGRALHEIGDEQFAAAVRTEVATEIDAVNRAELGDLSERVVQAVVLSRTSASPVQVAAADALLREQPLGGMQLFTAVDPTSAATAAAHWLHAAATVTAEASGYDVTQVVEIADDIEAVPTATPTLVLQMMEAGAAPHEAVAALVREAVEIAEGKLPNLPGLMDALTEAAQVAEAAESSGQLEPGENLLEKLVAEIHTTPLDTSRPALDLLEDLLTGIYACALLYREYEPDLDDEEHVENFNLDEVDDVVGAVLAQQETPVDQDGDDDEAGWPELASHRFLDAVRTQAAATADNLR